MTASLDLLPPSARLRYYAGDDSTVTFQFTRDGNAFSVDGTYLAQIRGTPESSVVLGTFTVDASAAASGLITLFLPRALASALPAGTTLAWDLQWTDADDVRQTLVRGVLILTSDVTR